jgi:voltage-gated potassium channel Kch
MLVQVLIGAVLLLCTTILHALGMSAALRWLSLARGRIVDATSLWIRSLVAAVVILIMFLVTLVEAGVWAAAYLGIGASTDFQTALYFSTVTYTTLGYGDLVLESHWRLLSSFQAVNGIIMFGWTTALIVLAVHLLSRRMEQLGAADG